MEADGAEQQRGLGKKGKRQGEEERRKGTENEEGFYTTKMLTLSPSCQMS